MYQVGDVVKVKSLEEFERDDIRNELGTFFDKANPRAPGFVREMQKYCENIFTVSDVKYRTKKGIYGYDDYIYKLDGIDWNFADFMLKPAEFDREKWKPKVGDRIRIREWDDMASEYGLNDLGNIDCEYTFTKEMAEFCGNTYTIDWVSDSGELVDFEECSGSYYISKDMIDPVCIDHLLMGEEYDQSTICSFFGDLSIV